MTNFNFCIDAFIKEEYDKNERRVPAWKIKWCKDNLTNMIGKDDEGVDLSSSMLKSQKTMGQKKRLTLKKKKTARKSIAKKSMETSLVQQEESEDSDVDMR